MNSVLAPILGQVDTRIIIMFAVMLGICVVLALIKKAFKIAVVVAIILVCAIYVIPMAKSFQEKYSFSIEDGVATVVTEGKTYSLDWENINYIKLKNEGFDGYALEFGEDDGVTYTKIPTFMVNSIRDFAKKYKIKIEVQE